MSNRVIKFRAFSKATRKMRYDVVPMGKSFLWGDTGISGEHAELDPFNYELMQFTGLLDSRGKEIYHKDLFRDSTGTSIVEWNEKFASWCLNRPGWMFDHFFGEAVNPAGGEVVGNLYQNPELLGGK